MTEIEQARALAAVSPHDLARPDDGGIVAFRSVGAMPIRGAIWARRTVEVYGVVGREATPWQRACALESCWRDLWRDLRAQGYADAHAFVDPKLRSFVRRLKQHGWHEPAWTPLVYAEGERNG